MGAHDEMDSILADERAEARALAKEHVDEAAEEPRCANERNHYRGWCNNCGLGMSR